VLAALSLPEFQQERYGRVRINTDNDAVPNGTYLLQLAVAEWEGIRPGREIWGAAVDSHGNTAPDTVVDALLASLASGSLKQPDDSPSSIAAATFVSETTQMLNTRLVMESLSKTEEAKALLQSRIESVNSQHERKIDSLRTRVDTARARQQAQAVKMFEGQIQNAESRHRQLMEQLSNSEEGGISVTPLAVCEVEIHHG
jgi:hypothetical protein